MATLPRTMPSYASTSASPSSSTYHYQPTLPHHFLPQSAFSYSHAPLSSSASQSASSSLNRSYSLPNPPTSHIPRHSASISRLRLPSLEEVAGKEILALDLRAQAGQIPNLYQMLASSSSTASSELDQAEPVGSSFRRNFEHPLDRRGSPMSHSSSPHETDPRAHQNLLAWLKEARENPRACDYEKLNAKAKNGQTGLVLSSKTTSLQRSVSLPEAALSDLSLQANFAGGSRAQGEPDEHRRRPPGVALSPNSAKGSTSLNQLASAALTSPSASQRHSLTLSAIHRAEAASVPVERSERHMERYMADPGQQASLEDINAYFASMPIEQLKQMRDVRTVEQERATAGAMVGRLTPPNTGSSASAATSLTYPKPMQTLPSDRSRGQSHHSYIPHLIY